ncbi:MAG: PepSY-associated TM helix domain-containing protein [Campylobacterales bacterium]
MRETFRQSMTWLHAYAGLLAGWVLFAVFLTGTTAYFRTEITFWMQPELHRSVPGEQTAELALIKLNELAPDAPSWMIQLPNERSYSATLMWREGRQEGRQGFKRVAMDAATGEVITPRATAGGDFLYRFHYGLYGLGHDAGHWVVSIFTMAMLVALVTGVIIHKRIFKDFFAFRTDASRVRGWLDVHVVAGVVSLPYHLMIALSGLVLSLFLLMPWGANLLFDGDSRKLMAQMVSQPSIKAPKAATDETGLSPIGAVLAEAKQVWPLGAGFITVNNPNRPHATVELRPRVSEDLTAGGRNGERLVFSGVTGERIAHVEPELSAGMKTYMVLNNLHRVHFADTPLRWLFFLAGALCTAMAATGLILWVAKRSRRQGERLHPGFWLVSKVNVAAIAGLMAAVAAFFWANRLLPATMQARADAEIGWFFGIWALMLVYALARNAQKAWIEQTAIAAFLWTLLPFLNFLTTESHLGVTLSEGLWLIAAFDLTALAVGLALCGGVYALIRAKRAKEGE